MEYEAVIGLEVHAHLLTQSKIFCGCATAFGAPPNTQVCEICLGMPGSLPVLNKKAVEYALKMALATNCRINPESVFARKNYFYPDLPKGYQISQYELPLAEHGHLDIKTNGQTKRIGITRIHLEEDAGKLIHSESRPVSFVDFNRTGVPLIEIVSEPDMQQPRRGGGVPQGPAQHSALSGDLRRQHGGRLLPLRRQHFAAARGRERIRGQGRTEEHELLPLRQGGPGV